VTKKSPIIRQDKVTDLMTQLANLPERKKAPDDPVSLTEIFRTKKYMAEIRRALKRGYGFGDLAEIFTERCGVAISARQIKYHYTHGNNQDVKAESAKEIAGNSVSKSRVSSGDSSRENTCPDRKESVVALGLEAESPSEVSEFAFENGTATGADGNVNPGAFSIDVRPKES
jgi:hypothetical protein